MLLHKEVLVKYYVVTNCLLFIKREVLLRQEHQELAGSVVLLRYLQHNQTSVESALAESERVDDTYISNAVHLKLLVFFDDRANLFGLVESVLHEPFFLVVNHGYELLHRHGFSVISLHWDYEILMINSQGYALEIDRIDSKSMA